MYRVALDLWQDDCPLARATADHEVTLTTPYWNFSPETGRWDLWIEASADDRSELEAGVRALGGAETMHRFELRRKRASSATVRALFDETAAIDAITAHGGAVIGPFTNRAGRERWHVGFTDSAAVDAALAALDRREDFAVVERTRLDGSDAPDVYRHFDAAAALLAGCDRLTGTERRVLRTAVERGYYATPRQETLATLGDRCGVSDAAISKTLRRAERKLLGAAVTALDDLGDLDGPDDPDRPRPARGGADGG
ncbi:helix-turn-helix domain-containing protein [Halomarina halobia]|uniref:Helix-turn-helix domain-containing protein n=1 Tax=Halomarina halobia TaxID=3033386 RepID=A0ABD6ACU1_9EURY|nr:helix-turn-helix domain-containing protein [Halomarina sp. PSR21]